MIYYRGFVLNLSTIKYNQDELSPAVDTTWTLQVLQLSEGAGVAVFVRRTLHIQSWHFLVDDLG